MKNIRINLIFKIDKKKLQVKMKIRQYSCSSLNTKMKVCVDF